MNSLFYIALGFCTHKAVTNPSVRQKTIETANTLFEAIKLGWAKGAEKKEEAK